MNFISARKKNVLNSKKAYDLIIRARARILCLSHNINSNFKTKPERYSGHCPVAINPGEALKMVPLKTDTHFKDFISGVVY